MQGLHELADRIEGAGGADIVEEGLEQDEHEEHPEHFGAARIIAVREDWKDRPPTRPTTIEAVIMTRMA